VRGGRRLILVGVSAVAFGVLMSALKGNGAGIRDQIGNLSAPWLLVPFLASALSSRGRLVRGAIVGVAASMLALCGFYVANSLVLQLGPHPWIDDLRLAVSGGRRWFVLALLSGPVFGVVGSLWRRSGARVLALLTFALLVAEPLADWVLQGGAAPGFWVSSLQPIVWVGESAVGVLACLAVLARPVRPVRPMQP
jgi:hypothetical protein